MKPWVYGRVMTFRHTVDLRICDDTIRPHDTAFFVYLYATLVLRFLYFNLSTSRHSQNSYDLGSFACVAFLISACRVSQKHGAYRRISTGTWKKFHGLKRHGKEYVSGLNTTWIERTFGREKLRGWFDWWCIADMLVSISILVMIWFIWRRRTDDIWWTVESGW